MDSAYSIEINRVDKRFRKVSLVLFGLAVCIFWIWQFVDLPVRGTPAEISIWYYFDFLPRWVLYFLLAALPLGSLSIVLSLIKKNSDGQLKIQNDFIEIASRKRTTKFDYADLCRISFLTVGFAFKPYRIEFIFPDKNVIRVKMKSKEEFYEAMEMIYDRSPVELEKYVGAFESEEK